MNYRRKSEIEAVKWDGKIETINDNKWLEEAIKEDIVLLAMNDIDDKEPVLLIFDSWTRGYDKVEVNDYIIREKHNQKHRIRIMDSDKFEQYFEVVESKNNNCFVVDLELNTEEFCKNLNKVKEEIDRLFGRDNLEKCKITTCMNGQLDSVSSKRNKEIIYEVHM